jgi:hypothetical protein
MKLITFALLLTATLHAGSESHIALAAYRPAESPVSIVVPAQFLAAEIRIESDEDDWSLKISGIEAARRLLSAEAEKHGFSVRIDQSLVFVSDYGKFSFSSSSRDAHNAVSDVLLLAPLSEGSHLIQILKKYKAIISELKTEKNVEISLGSINLALENPEELRVELLNKIRVHVDESAKILSDSPDFTISGLDEPVRVRQKGEREIEAYLPFRVSYSRKK